MSEDLDLFRVLTKFVSADTPDEARQLIEQHPELLTHQADIELQVLGMYTSEDLTKSMEGIVKGRGTSRAVESRRLLLRYCREFGVDSTFAQYGQATWVRGSDASPRPGLTFPDRLPSQLQEAMSEIGAGVSTWADLAMIAQRHPVILSDEGDAALADLERLAEWSGDPNVEGYGTTRAFFARCREVGIDQGFREMMDPGT